MIDIRRRLLVLSLLTSAACGSGGGGGGSSSSAPANLAYDDDVALYLVHTAASANAPTYDGTVDAFTIAPALPAGLVLDPATGVIAGTPTEAAPRTRYTVRAENAAGAAEADVEIVVNEPQRFAYVISGAEPSISIFTADVASGRLQRKGYVVPAAGEIAPERMTISPDARFAYVTNAGSSNVSVYAIDAASGALTAGSPVAAGAGPHALAIDPTGRFAYVANAGSDTLGVYAIDALSGALASLGAPVASATGPIALALDPSGRFLFVALRGHPTTGAGSGVQAYSVDTLSGALTPAGGLFALGNAKPSDLAVDAVRAQLYVTHDATDSVETLAYDTTDGTLSTLLDDAAGDRPSALALDPTGRFAYVANREAGTVSAFRIDAASGELDPIGTVPTGAWPLDLQVDPTGRHLYVVGHDAREIARFAIDDATGALALEETLATHGSAGDIVFLQGATPVGWIPRIVTTANAGSNDVSSFAVAPASGALSALGSPLLAGLGPVSVAIDPELRWSFVATEGSSSIVRFTLDPATGEPLEGSAPMPPGGNPTHVAIDPSGRFLYVSARDVVAADDGWLFTFAIDADDGVLTEIDAQPVGARPTWVATDPTGEFLYVANNGDGTPGTGSISVFEVAALTGLPTVSAPTATAPGVYGLAFHPDGKHLYAALRGADITVHFTIDRASGALSFMNGARAGNEPSAVSVTPDGRHAYIAYRDTAGAGHVALYRVDAETRNLLPPAELFLDGTHPVDLAVEPSGRFLYVANQGSDTVSVMTIDTATGMLSIGTPISSGVMPSAIAVGAVTQ